MKRSWRVALILTTCTAVQVASAEGTSGRALQDAVAEVKAKGLSPSEACTFLRSTGSKLSLNEGTPERLTYSKLEIDFCQSGIASYPDEDSRKELQSADLRTAAAIAGSISYSRALQNEGVERVLNFVREIGDEESLYIAKGRTIRGQCMERRSVTFCPALHDRRSEVDQVFTDQKQRIQEKWEQRQAAAKERDGQEQLALEERQKQAKAVQDAAKKRIADLIAKHRAQELDPNNAYKLSKNPFAYKGKTMFMLLSYMKNIGPKEALFTVYPERDVVELRSSKNFVNDRGIDLFPCVFKMTGTTTILVDAKRVEIPALREIECIMD